LFTPASKKVEQGTESFVRENDSQIGARVQAALFAHPIRDQYDAFVNTDLSNGSIIVHWSTDQKSWKKKEVGDFPYETFVRVADVSAPFYFKLERRDESGQTSVSAVRTLRLTK